MQDTYELSFREEFGKLKAAWGSCGAGPVNRAVGKAMFVAGGVTYAAGGTLIVGGSLTVMTAFFGQASGDAAFPILGGGTALLLTGRGLMEAGARVADMPWPGPNSMF